MKRFMFSVLAIMIMITVQNKNAVAQTAPQYLQVITSSDTIYYLLSEVKVNVISLSKTPAQIQDSIKKCLMSGKWYGFKTEKSSGPGYTNWTEYSVPSKTAYDLYSKDSTWTYSNNVIQPSFAASYTISNDGTQMFQSKGISTIQLLEVTMNELKWSNCDNNGCYRVTQRHTMLSK